MLRSHYFAFYKHPNTDEVACVQSGPSILAFLFGPLWLLFHKLWAPFWITSMILVVAQLIASEFQDFLFYFSLLVNLIIAVSTAYWRESRLIRRGLRLICSVPAKNKAEAQWRLMQLPNVTA